MKVNGIIVRTQIQLISIALPVFIHTTVTALNLCAKVCLHLVSRIFLYVNRIGMIGLYCLKTDLSYKRRLTLKYITVHNVYIHYVL